LLKFPRSSRFMEDKQTRVRWDEKELGRLAAAMAPRLLADPDLPPLEAVRAAQDCLEPGRRRDLKAWSLVAERLQPKLDEALARLRALPSSPVADEGRPPVGSPAPSVDESVDLAEAEQPGALPLPAVAAPDGGGAEADAPGPSAEAGDGAAAALDVAETSGQSLTLFDDAGATTTTATTVREPGRVTQPAAVALLATAHGKPAQRAVPVTVDPAMIEAALIAALQSPAVEEALIELFTRTLSKALLRTGTGEPRPVPQAPRPSSAPRVLLAGFPDAQQKALMEALGERFEVRSWKPTNGPQVFQTLARLLSTKLIQGLPRRV
jgi:hypothetical protein